MNVSRTRATVLSAYEASKLSAQTLGIGSGIDLASAEGIAESLRRAASFMCPTSPRNLIDAVFEAVYPVSPDGSISRDRVAEILDLIVGEGDLLELRHGVERSTQLLYLGPPSFIEVGPNTYLLLGVRPYGMPLVAEELSGLIDWNGHTRVIRLNEGRAAERLTEVGLRQLLPERWVAGPRKESAAALLQRIGVKLDAAAPSGDIADLLLLDPAAPVRYYKGRWRKPKLGDSGTFVMRRPQAYGADLWGAVRLDGGMPKRMVEFPTDDPLNAGRDEGWRMQSAIDAVRGAPQVFRVNAAPEDAKIISFFSPLPGFAERYLELVGLPLAASPGALIAFKVPQSSVPALSDYLTEMLWMKRLSEEAGL